MAKTQPGRLVYSLIDSSGVRSSLAVPVLMDPSATLAALSAAWLAQAVLLDAVTGAQILGGSVAVESASLTGLKTSPVAGELMERGGLVNYPFNVPAQNYGSLIPCIDSGILTSSGKQINEGAAAFTAYIAPFETAPATWEATSNTRIAFNGPHTGTDVVFRKHRRARRHVSEERP